MFIAGEISGADITRRMALGNNLTEDFVPLDRLHLNHSNATMVKMRFSNTATGVGALDGSNLGIEDNGDFRLTQFEARNTSIFTPSNLNPGTAPIERFRVAPNGQVFIGSHILAENVIDAAPIAGFSQLGDD